jgi:hypothetical protein
MADRLLLISMISPKQNKQFELEFEGGRKQTYSRPIFNNYDE